MLQEKKEKAEKEDEPQEMRRWQFSFPRPVEVMADGWLINPFERMLENPPKKT